MKFKAMTKKEHRKYLNELSKCVKEIRAKNRKMYCKDGNPKEIKKLLKLSKNELFATLAEATPKKITQSSLNKLWEDCLNSENERIEEDPYAEYIQILKKQNMESAWFEGNYRGYDEAIEFLIALLKKNGIPIYNDPSTEGTTDFGFVVKKN